MPRPKKKPSIEEQLRSVIAQATDEGQFVLAKTLIDLLDTRTIKSTGPGHAPIVIEQFGPPPIAATDFKEEEK